MNRREGEARGARALAAALTLAALLAAAHVAFLIAGSPPEWETAASTWAYNGALVLCGVTCLIRAGMSRKLRGAWTAFGIGLLAWAAADIYWTVELSELRRIPYPSPADAGYLAALPCFFVGVALLSRQRVGQFTTELWIDGITAALAAGAVGVALLAPALVGLTRGDTAAVMTNLAYPLGDLILIAFVAGAIVVSGLRGAGALLLIAAGLIVWTGADSLYLYLEATSSYTEGWLDTLWTAGALLIALSAAFSVRHAPARRTAYRSPRWAPGLIAGAAGTLLVVDHFSPAHEASVWLAGGALLGVAIRLAMSFRETDRLLDALHHEAVTDSLTGLANRRQLITDLDAAMSRHRPPKLTLALFDLDGFKAYNDAFGHPAGDALLRQLGRRLAGSVRGAGTAYRLGGDEFCVLVAADDAAPQRVADARSALSTHGEGFAIGASCGSAGLPTEAGTASQALLIVDQRMYAEKGKRSSRVARQTHELLVGILREREPNLGDHSEGVAQHAARMAEALGLDAETRDVVRRAAELHDIGKIAIPDEILNRPGPLDASEWELMRRHTLVGERILGTAPALRPVAEIVRASHERWDGAGYPDGVSGDAIPLGARIVFICDAFDAMTSARSYQQPIAEAEAIAELRRHAGTQFDPELVRVFAELRESGGARGVGELADATA
jgi:two-component system, cell cycle response regulator